MTKRFILLFFMGIVALPVLATTVQAQPLPQYLSPVPGARMIQPATTIAFRPGDLLAADSVSSKLFEVRGSVSGLHSGRAVLADDGRTIIFEPDYPFAYGETVSVAVGSGLFSSAAQPVAGVSYSFETARQPSPKAPVALDEIDPNAPQGNAPAPASAYTQPNAKYLTLPTGYPSYTVTVPANGVADGALFVAPFTSLNPTGLSPYLLILDNSGDPVFYKQIPLSAVRAMDFKRQANGLLTYFEAAASKYYVLDNSYNNVDSYQAGNGYFADEHDLQILPNGHALLMSYDLQIVDMSAIVPGGYPAATVTGLIIQELDTTKNVVFQWRSWDHFNITDTFELTNVPLVDYVHGNAIAQDRDGNLLVSSRHMSEITKIDRQTGNIIWRLGGKNNQFNFTNKPEMFAYQHDIRRLPNGNITLWDNRNGLLPIFSGAEEYLLDEVAKTATLVWQYRDTPDAYSGFMGNAQRLPNGNTLTGWGGNSSPAVIEVKPDGSKAFELILSPGTISYRAFRPPWHGYPSTQPTLIAQTKGVTTTLAYSWNGATEIASYRIYGGDAPYPTNLIATQPKTAFEEHTLIVSDYRYCYFRVMPVDNQGNNTRYSNEVFLAHQPCYNGKLFLPFILN